MLAEFNSEQAIGSAMREADKSANNWSGSLNKLKNSWTELVNEVVTSDEAITVIQALNSSIQDLSNSKTIKGIGVTTSAIVQLIGTLSSLKEKAEDIPVFGKIFDTFTGYEQITGMGFFKRVASISDFLNKDSIEAEKAARKQEELNKTWKESTKTLEEESSELKDLTAEYIKIYSESDNVADVSKQLIEIQNKLIDTYGDEAEGIDLVNGSIEEQVKALIKLREEKNKQYLKDNEESIEAAYKWFGINPENDNDISSETHSAIKFDISEITSGQYDQAKAEADEYFNKIQSYIEDKYPELVKNIDFTKNGTASIDTVFAATIKEGLSSTQITEAIKALNEAYSKVLSGQKLQFFNSESIVNKMQDWEDSAIKVNSILQKVRSINAEDNSIETLIDDEKTYKQYLELLKQIGKYKSDLDNKDSSYADRVIASRYLQVALVELQKISDQYPAATEIISSSLNEMGVSFDYVTKSIEESQDAWKKSLDEAQKGVLSDIDNIKSAMQSLAEGKNLSSKDFWEIAGLDTESILSDIEVINGEFSVGVESLMNLKDSIIREQIEDYQNQIDQIKAENKDALEQLETYSKEVAELEKEIQEKNIDLTQTVFGNIDTDSRQILEWTTENLSKYEDAIESWGSSLEDLAGDVSTVFGAWGTYGIDETPIAFSPILQTENGAVMLKRSTVEKYIKELIDNAGEGWTTELLLELDSKGLEIDGYRVKNLIADIGDTAEQTAEKMHYVGKTGAFERAKEAYNNIDESAKGFLGTLKNLALMQNYLNSMLGNTVDVQKALEVQKKKLEDEVSALKKEADARLKAQLHVIDQEIDKHEKEVDLLEKEKDALNDQLEALEKQKEELDKIVGNYDTVASFVQSTIEKQIEEIEDNRSKVEDYYDSLINKLKEENDERQAAIDKEEKLNALNNAKKNKVRYYDGARGWTYGVDQEALKKAQKDLDAFEADEKINALEKEKDLKLKPYDDQIKQLEEYAESWGKATDFIIEESNELLAEQILGANWREKIENKDENILKSFQTQYRNYNTQLDTLTNKEIESLNKSISAKDNEIEAKQEQVTWWKNYKDSIQAATKGVEDYVQYLNTVDLSNPEKNLTNFTTIYNNFVTDISSKEADIVRITNELNNLGSAYSGLGGNSMAAGLGSSLGGMSGIATQLKYVANNLSAVFSTVGNREKTLDEIKNIVDQIENNQEKVYPEIHVSQKGEKIKPVTAYASGGVNTNTGMAWLDGTVTRPELILNNTDVSKLYNWIHTMSSSQAILQSKSNGIAKTSNAAIFNISNMEINGVQNPIEFAKQFEQNINRYWNTKLTESKVY